MRPHGSPEELFHRRQRAVGLLERGFSKPEVARRVDADLRSVRRWHRAYRAGGEAALRPKPVPGAPPKLAVEQREALVEALLEGARAAGFDSDLWTGPRVAELIRRRFGVSYHKRYVLRVLRSLGFTPQRPEDVAQQQDPVAKARWLRWQWPAIKKNRRPHGGVAGVPR